MRRICILVLIFTIASCSNPARKDPKNDKEFDNWSGIELSRLTNEKPENLQLLGMVWGFLKYYHPAVGKGLYNWDYELFRMMPSYLDAETIVERDQVLLRWINSLGEFKTGKKGVTADKAAIKISPDLDWIGKSGFSPELVAKLNEVRNAKRPEKHYYLALTPGAGNPVFNNENSYSWKNSPDPGFRLLALYRYWNIIQYYFPYKNLIERDWKDVLKEYIPVLISAKNEIAYRLALIRLIGQVHDSHAQVYGQDKSLSDYFGSNYAPAELSFIEGKAVVTGFYHEKYKEETGLATGDVVTSINQKSIDSILVERLPLNPASNYPTQLRNLAAKLLRTTETSINIEIERDHKFYSKVLKTYPMSALFDNRKQEHDTCFKMLSPRLAYIHNGALKKGHIPKLWEIIRSTEGLIIDIRNYPGDFPLYDLGKYLLPERLPFVKFTTGSIENPGLFSFTKTLKIGKTNKEYYRGKVVILVNEQTQSSAEFHAMAYQVTPGAKVIGSTTAGADGNVSQLFLPGGIKTMISGIGVYYPDGKETQRVGIVPDLEIKPTIEGVKAGRDEVLEKAIEFFGELKSS